MRTLGSNISSWSKKIFVLGLVNIVLISTFQEKTKNWSGSLEVGVVESGMLGRLLENQDMLFFINEFGKPANSLVRSLEPHLVWFK